MDESVDVAGPADATQPLRSDAELNRARILVAARQVFAERGLDTSMAEIARRAGVGIATLYRRFPTRDDLAAAVFDDRMDAYVAATTEALADPDPWHAFRAYVERVCAMQAADRGFADVLILAFPTAKRLEAKRAQAYHGMLALTARAKQSGRLRADFSPEDLVLLLMANAGVLAATGSAAPDAWRRLVGYMIQAFAAPAPGACPGSGPGIEAENETEPLPPAPAPAEMYRAMVRLNTACPGGAGSGAWPGATGPDQT